MNYGMLILLIILLILAALTFGAIYGWENLKYLVA